MRFREGRHLEQGHTEQRPESATPPASGQMRALPLGPSTLRSYFYPQDSRCEPRLLTYEEGVETPQPLLPQVPFLQLDPDVSGSDFPPRAHLELVRQSHSAVLGTGPQLPSERIIASFTLSNLTSPPRVLFREAGDELSSPRVISATADSSRKPSRKVACGLHRVCTGQGTSEWASWRREAATARNVSLGPSLSLSPDHRAHLHSSSSGCFE